MYTIMPEAHYQCENLSINQVHEAYVNGKTITGLVEGIIPGKQELTVRLGQDVFATLPFSEVTIYPFRYSAKSKLSLPTNIRCLLGRKIRAQVIYINGTDILISRKKNMEKAYKYLCTFDRAKLYITQVIRQSVFGDIGEGLVGKMYISEICKSHIKNANEYLRPNQTVDVVMLGADDEMRFATSYRQTFKPYCRDDYPIGTTVHCKVGDWIMITDVSKYYVNITPQVAGFMLINEHIYLDYGTDIECTVIGANDSGLILEFVKTL